jgi:hypothetical protein
MTDVLNPRLDIRRQFFLGSPMQKEDFYKGVKTVGFITFIPFMLAAGPLSGYFVGDFLQKRFNLSHYVVLTSIAFGFILGVMEMVRILKIVTRMNKK